MTTPSSTITRPNHRPGMPSGPVGEIAEPEHDELSRLAFKLVSVLDGAQSLPGDIGFDQREVDIIAYLRAFPGSPLVAVGEVEDEPSSGDDVIDAFLAGFRARTPR
jgi:hypothetical protein